MMLFLMHVLRNLDFLKFLEYTKKTFKYYYILGKNKVSIVTE